MIKRLIQKKRKLNNNGFTLVEMIVTFALVGIFMVAASYLIFSSMDIYYHMKGISYGRQVSAMISNKVVGEIEGAKVGSAKIDESGALIEKTLIIKDSGNTIELYDGTGSHIEISTKNDYLNIYYYPVKSDNNGMIEDRYQETNWKFDKKAYMEYKIKSMKFTQASSENSDYPDNIIKLELVIENDRYGEYTYTEYIECYNFITADDMAHIEVQ